MSDRLETLRRQLADEVTRLAEVGLHGVVSIETPGLDELALGASETGVDRISGIRALILTALGDEANTASGRAVAAHLGVAPGSLGATKSKRLENAGKAIDRVPETYTRRRWPPLSAALVEGLIGISVAQAAAAVRPQEQRAVEQTTSLAPAAATQFLLPHDFPQSGLRIGNLGHIESLHNYGAISQAMSTTTEQKLQIGSPYMRYWLESEGICRLERLMNGLPRCQVEVVLFSRQPTRRDADHPKHARRLRALAAEREALQVAFPKHQTDLSYITYEFETLGGETRRRLMLGLQIAEYADRPFVEIVTASDAPDPMSAAVLAWHANLMAGTA